MDGVSLKVRMPPPFLVSEYIASNPDCLDANGFGAILDAGTVKEPPDLQDLKRLTEVGGCQNHWNHWGTWMSDDCRSAQ